MAKVPPIVLNLLFDDIKAEITESNFSDEPNKQTPKLHLEFGGYFSAEAFLSSPEKYITELFAHSWDKLSSFSAEQQHLVLGGDGLSSFCYNDHQPFVWTDRLYFR